MRVFVAAVRRAFLEEDSDAMAHQATALSFIHLDDAAAGDRAGARAQSAEGRLTHSVVRSSP